ncbi:MAG: TolC family protein [Planctomycetaceae bacterium]
MQKTRVNWTSALLLCTVVLQGCAGPDARLQYLWGEEHKALSYYRDYASAVEYPTFQESEPTDQSLFNAPRGINSFDKLTDREVYLNECIRMALEQATILRDDGSFGSPGNPLMSRPNQVASTYDQAIQNTGFLFGNRGYEAALSDFDALLTTSMTWGRSEEIQNAINSGVPAGATLVGETAAYSTRIEKPLANSGQIAVQNDWNYSGSNSSLLRFPSVYTGFLQAEYRQPFLAGSGTEVTRIAGPLSQNLRGVSGVSQGVLISRINSDISLTDFEQSVTSMVRDVERLYWDLYLSLRLYDSEIDAFKDLLRYYNDLRDRDESGDAQTLALSRIYEAEARIKGSLADMMNFEARLRRLIGLPLNDGTFLYPVDTPSEAQLKPDWEASLTEALSNRLELRRQKWEIRSLELQLSAARNLARPRFDFVSQYRVNGFGDNLDGGKEGIGNALDTLTGGNQTSWNLGFQFSMPLGLRLAQVQVRNYELRLQKARAALSQQEREIAYELSNAMLEMDRWYNLADSTTRRIRAADDAVVLTEERYEIDGRPVQALDLLLQRKIQQRDAQQAYVRSVVEYNKAITDMNFRKGVLLTNNAVYLAEGNWHPAASPFAKQRAVDRTHAQDNHRLQTEPIDFVAGPAAVSWESLNTETRPSYPGADGTASSPEAAPAHVPDVPDTLELPPDDADKIPAEDLRLNPPRPDRNPKTPKPNGSPDVAKSRSKSAPKTSGILRGHNQVLKRVTGVASEIQSDASTIRKAIFDGRPGKARFN